MAVLPRYPVYVISKGRAASCLTAKFLVEDKVPFRLVVEPQEADEYRAKFGDHVEVLPFSNLGLGSIPARNWCWEQSKAAGHERHWILDDNIHRVRRLYKGHRLPVAAGPAFACIEDFADRWQNLAIAGLNYTMFTMPRYRPYFLNVHVYSAMLILNELPFRWRGRYNEDTDLCLQVLSSGWCTVLTNAFCVDKVATMTMKGGNTDELYKSRGRLKMARSLERVWPYAVETKRKFKRPQHHVRGNWRGFDTRLVPKPGVELKGMRQNEYGMELRQVREQVQSPVLRELLESKR